MARPSCCRRVSGKPAAYLFLPAAAEDPDGTLCDRDPVIVTLDEFEALRLADGCGMKQEDAAREMQVSRPTFGRVLESAHSKVAVALVEGRPIRIEGGSVCTVDGCEPRDCPRWSHGGGAAGRVAPCGKTLDRARRR